MLSAALTSRRSTGLSLRTTWLLGSSDSLRTYVAVSSGLRGHRRRHSWPRALRIEDPNEYFSGGSEWINLENVRFKVGPGATVTFGNFVRITRSADRRPSMPWTPDSAIYFKHRAPCSKKKRRKASRTSSAVVICVCFFQGNLNKIKQTRRQLWNPHY